MSWYFDTSVLTKLVVAEAETTALMEWIAADERSPVSCDLVRTELARAVRRSAPDRMVRARLVLESITLLQVSSAIFDSAGKLGAPGLRSLDAIHLAAALDLGDDLDGFVTYDARQADAATELGVPVVAPA